MPALEILHENFEASQEEFRVPQDSLPQLNEPPIRRGYQRIVLLNSEEYTMLGIMVIYYARTSDRVFGSPKGYQHGSPASPRSRPKHCEQEASFF